MSIHIQGNAEDSILVSGSHNLILQAGQVLL